MKSLEGVWVKQIDTDHFTVLAIGEAELYCYFVTPKQGITKENIASVLSDAPAYFYSHTYELGQDKSALILTENDTQYEYTVSSNKTEMTFSLSSANDPLVMVNGDYTFVSESIENLTPKSAANMLTQDFLNDVWIKNADISSWVHDTDLIQILNGYIILFVNPYYSNVMKIMTTLDLETGIYSAEEGFRCYVLEDMMVADLFYDIMVEDETSIRIVYTGEEAASFVLDGSYRVLMTNDGFYLSSKNNPLDERNGFYYSEPASESIEGVWVAPFEDDQDRDSRYIFTTFDNGEVRTSWKIFSGSDVIDHTNLQEYYEQSEAPYPNDHSWPYQKFESGQIQYSGVCTWPIYVTEKLCIMGVPAGFNATLESRPEYWAGYYKLG